MTMIQITPPPSKSVTHRAFLLAALTGTECRVNSPLLSGDTRSTLGALKGLGARCEVTENAVLFHAHDGLRPMGETIDCANSGTTLRLMLAQAALLQGSIDFIGDASLSGRPNEPLLDALRWGGATCSAEGGRLPISINGPIRKGSYCVDVTVSSQFASALVLALPFVDGDSTLTLKAPIVSRPYLDLSIAIGRQFGLSYAVQETPHEVVIEILGGQSAMLASLTVEADWSTAAFPLIASILSGRAVRLLGLRKDSLQGDRGIIEVIERFGQAPRWEGDVLVLTPSEVQAPGDIDLSNTPDMFPAISMLAAMAHGVTTLSGAAHLRHKESDRIAQVISGLHTVGIKADEREDGAVIQGGAVTGGVVDSANDHRVLMAFECLGLIASETVSVTGRGHEAVSYPSFYSDLAKFR